MGFRYISAWSIRNPVPSIVLFLALTLAGIVSFMTMQVNQQPDIDFPVVVVVISQPGAAPTELENQVTQKVENALRSLSGVDEINSTVTEGNSQTVVQLQIGTKGDRVRHAGARRRDRGCAQRAPAGPQLAARRHPGTAGHPHRNERQ